LTGALGGRKTRFKTGVRPTDVGCAFNFFVEAFEKSGTR
jgi:hypothetical protein